MKSMPRLFLASLIAAAGCGGGGNAQDAAMPDLAMQVMPDLAMSMMPDMAMSMSGGDMATSNVACTMYCMATMSACGTAGMPNSQYPDGKACIAACTKSHHWPAGMMGDMSGNSLACRAYHAGAASMNAATHCPHAGPSGGNVCGTWCENYCFLALQNCTGMNALYADMASCATACAGIPSGGKPNDTGGDTVQCRIYHLGVAGTDATAAMTHCPHGKVQSAVCM